MQYRTLGGTDLRLSEVGFGVWTLTTGWWGKFEEPEMFRMLRLAVDLRPRKDSQPPIVFV